jgi:peptide/nickel transport system substrate-binding protein
VPVIDEFTMQVTPDADSATLKLKQGEVDMIRILPADQTADVQHTPGLTVDIYDVFQFTFYGMNLDPARTPLFQDRKVRQALFMALDRKSITDNIFFGFGEPAIGTQPRTSPAYAPDRMTPDYAFDPAKAKQLLAEAGWTDTNGNGTVDKDGVEFKFRLVYGSGDQTVDALVAYMQQAWKEVGVSMEPDGIDSDVWIDQLRSHDFDMTLLAVNFSPDGSQGPFFTCDAYNTGFNFWKYCNPQYDALDQQQRRDFDPASRTELLIQQSQIIWQDQPVGPIRFGVYRTGYTQRLHNFYPNGFGLLWSLTYVWMDAS